VLRLLLQGLRGADYTFSAVVLTGGQGVINLAAGELNVAKTELIGMAQMLLQTRRLLIARELPHADLLVRELKNYRPKTIPGPTARLSAAKASKQVKGKTPCLSNFNFGLRLVF